MLFLPLVLIGQNQPPSITTPLPNQLLDQAGDSVEIDLTNFISDPDVPSPAVQLDVSISGNTQQIHLAFFSQDAPLTVANFIRYIEAGRFTDNLIHRSVPGFIIQGGGFRFNGSAIGDIPSFPDVQNEPGISNTRGTVAMAKLDNKPDSATSGWFINLANNASNLDNQTGGFTVFARVLSNGMSVADQVAALGVFDASFDLGGAFEDLPLSAANLARSSFVETSASLVSPLQFTASSSNTNLVVANVDSDGKLQLTPSQLNSGDATITIVATDLQGGKTETSFIVTVNSNEETYADWRTKYDFINEDSATASADPDQDGWINLIEYTLGTDPLAPTKKGTRIKALAGRNMQLKFLENVTSEIRVESSTDLNNWTFAWQSNQGNSGNTVVSWQRLDKQVTVILRPNPFIIDFKPPFWRVIINEAGN